MSDPVAEIQISKSLYDQIAKFVESSGGEFSNVREFVEFVIRESLKQEESVFSEEDQKGIEDRLKSLGYL